MLQRKQGDVKDSKCQEQGHPCQESQPCQDCVTKTLEVMGNSKCKGTDVGMNSAVWLEILLQVGRKCLPWGPKPFTSFPLPLSPLFPRPNWPGIGGEGLGPSVKTETQVHISAGTPPPPHSAGPS